MDSPAFVALGVPAVLAALGFILLASQMPAMSLGRALRVRNRKQLPTLTDDAAWNGAVVVLQAPLAAAERVALGELWLEMARAEHASVPAFAQLGLQLSALGAPPQLIAATHRAALEEIEHARRSFAIATAITGAPCSAGPIPALAYAKPADIDLPRLAVESLVDGCLAEGLAADIAARGAELADEPAITDFLATIAREEATHAELAWQLLAWALERGGVRAHRAVTLGLSRVAIATCPPAAGHAGRAAKRSPALLARFGHLDQETLARLFTARTAAVCERARRLLAAPQRQAA